jgi:hypothetical protein
MSKSRPTIASSPFPWQKPSSKRFRQILLPHGCSRKEVRPERPERRLRLVSAIARGRRWLDEIVSGSVTDAEQIALRERCSVRLSTWPSRSPFLLPNWSALPGGPPASGHQYRAAARCSGGMESAVQGAWVKSATTAYAQTTGVANAAGVYHQIAISAHSKWTASQTVGCCGSVHSTRWRFLAGMKT